MKVAPNNVNINFGKTFKANCKVLKDGKPIPCKIYELQKEDKDYFESDKTKKDWKNAFYTIGAKSSIEQDKRYCNENIYVLEDKNEKCLALAVTENTDSFDYNRKELMFFEAVPGHKEHYKYIGETFINFLCCLCKSEGIEAITVDAPNDDALPFYEKSQFKTYPRHLFENDLTLEGESMDKLIAQNEKHTGSKINYIL